MGATHQLQVLGWLFMQIVSQFLVKAGQVLHLHLDPVFTQVVMPLEFIPLVVNKGAGRQKGCTEGPSAAVHMHPGIGPHGHQCPHLSQNTPNCRPLYPKFRPEEGLSRKGVPRKNDSQTLSHLYLKVKPVRSVPTRYCRRNSLKRLCSCDLRAWPSSAPGSPPKLSL